MQSLTTIFVQISRAREIGYNFSVSRIKKNVDRDFHSRENSQLRKKRRQFPLWYAIDFKCNRLSTSNEEFIRIALAALSIKSNNVAKCKVCCHLSTKWTVSSIVFKLRWHVFLLVMSCVYWVYGTRVIWMRLVQHQILQAQHHEKWNYMFLLLPSALCLLPFICRIYRRSPAIDLLCRVDWISNFPLCGWKYPVFRRLTWFKTPELIGLLLIFNLFMPDVYAKMTKTNVFAQSLFVGKNVSNIGNNCYQQKCWYRRKMNQHQDCKILLIFYQH